MRCRACNNILSKREILWDEKNHKHEDLCYKCRTKILDSFVSEGYEHIEKVFLIKEEEL